MTELNYKETMDFRVTNIGAWAHQMALDLGSQVPGLTFEINELTGSQIKNFDLMTSTAHEKLEGRTGDGVRCNIIINTQNELNKSDIVSINSFFDNKNLGSVRDFK